MRKFWIKITQAFLSLAGCILLSCSVDYAPREDVVDFVKAGLNEIRLSSYTVTIDPADANVEGLAHAVPGYVNQFIISLSNPQLFPAEYALLTDAPDLFTPEGQPTLEVVSPVSLRITGIPRVDLEEETALSFRITVRIPETNRSCPDITLSIPCRHISSAVEVALDLSQGASQAMFFTPNPVQVGVGASLVISLPSASPLNAGTDWVWYVDGVVQSGATSSSYTFNPSGWLRGQYTVSAFTTLNGVRYSGNLSVLVVDPLLFPLRYDLAGGSATGLSLVSAYAPGAPVTVFSGTLTPPSGLSGFSDWETSDLGTPGQLLSGGATFAMPSNAVLLRARWSGYPATSNLSALAGNASVRLDWTDPASSAFLFHVLSWQNSAGTTMGGIQVPAGLGSYTVGGLSNGETYTFTLTGHFSGTAETVLASVRSTPRDPSVVDQLVDVPCVTNFLQEYSSSTFNNRLDPFRIGRTEVTYERWYAVRQWAHANGYVNIRPGKEGSSGVAGTVPQGSLQPVTDIMAKDVVVWCNALSEMNGLEPAYYSDTGGTQVFRDAGSLAAICYKPSANGFRLPTLGEWQYAARYRDGSSWTPAVSPSVPSGTAAASYPEYAITGTSGTANVASRLANPLGLYDMSGNLAEMVWDSFVGALSFLSFPYYNLFGNQNTVRQALGGAYTGAITVSTTISMSNPAAPTLNTGFRVARNGWGGSVPLPGSVWALAAVNGSNATLYAYRMNSDGSIAATITANVGSGYTITALRVHPRLKLIMVGLSSGEIYLYRIENGVFRHVASSSFAPPIGSAIIDIECAPSSDAVFFITNSNVYVAYLNTINSSLMIVSSLYSAPNAQDLALGDTVYVACKDMTTPGSQTSVEVFDYALSPGTDKGPFANTNDYKPRLARFGQYMILLQSTPSTNDISATAFSMVSSVGNQSSTLYQTNLYGLAAGNKKFYYAANSGGTDTVFSSYMTPTIQTPYTERNFGSNTTDRSMAVDPEGAFLAIGNPDAGGTISIAQIDSNGNLVGNVVTQNFSGNPCVAVEFVRMYE